MSFTQGEETEHFNISISERTIWKAHKDRVRSIAYLPDELGIVSGSSDKKVSLWDRSTFTLEKRDSFLYSVAEVAGNPDGSAYGAAIYDGNAPIWLLPGGRRKELPKQMTAHYAATFSPNGQWYAMGYHHGSIILFPTSTYKQNFLDTESNYGAPIGLAFSSSSLYLAASYSKNRIAIWDVQKGEAVREFPIDRAGKIAILESAEQLIIGTVWLGDEKDREYPDSVQVLNLETGELLHELENARSGIAVSPDNKVLACCSQEGGAQFWDTTRWHLLGSVEVPGETTLCTAISFENNQVACGTHEGSIAVFDITFNEKGRELKSYTIEKEAETLELARQQLQDQIPDGLVVITEKVIHKEISKTLQGDALTEKEAFKSVLRMRPENSRVVRKEVLVPAINQDIMVEAFDEQTAKSLAISEVQKSIGESSDIRLHNLNLTVKGNTGFLGIGKKPNKYIASIRRDASVEITFTAPAKILVEIGTPEEKLVASELLASLKKCLGKECAAAIAKIAQLGLDILSAREQLYIEPLIMAPWVFGRFDMHNAKLGDMVVKILVNMGDFAFQYLSEVMKTDQNYRQILRSCIALAKMHDRTYYPTARNKIVNHLNGYDQSRAQEAVIALAYIGDKFAIDRLADVVAIGKNRSEDVRTEAAQVLGEIGDPSAMAALTVALDDPSFRIAMAARFALQSIDSKNN